jgi:ABC-2 type transport system ATP-binding protein
MPDLAIRTQALRKTYRTRRGKRVVAVQGLDLEVPVGGVHGFLGPNGSGKTTSIRMPLGLVRADAGTMTVFDQVVPDHLPMSSDGSARSSSRRSSSPPPAAART